MAKVTRLNFPFTIQTPNKMNTIPQSIAWWCFVPEKLTPEQFVGAVADAGYKGIELVPPEYWSLVTDHGLALSAIGGHQPLTIGLNRRDLHDRLEEEIKANIENARRLKIPNLICFSRNRSYCLGCSGVSSRQFAACEVSNDIYHMQIMEGD